MAEDLEKRLAEVISKKEKAEKAIESKAGKRISALEQAIKNALGDIVKDVTATVVDRKLKIVIYPNEKYADCLETTAPMEYTTTLTRAEQQDLINEETSIIRRIVEVVLDRFMMNYMKLQLLSAFGVEPTARRISRPRALQIFAYLCQKGSALHCTGLYNAVAHLVREAVNEEDKSMRKYFTDNIKKAGFSKLADFLNDFNPADFYSEQLDDIAEVLKNTLREVISKYGRIVYDVDALPSDEIEKTKRILMESCKEPDYLMMPQPFDETPIFNALRRLSEVMPNLKKYLPEVVERPTPAPAPTPTPTPPAPEAKPEAKKAEDLLKVMRELLREKRKKYE